MAFLTINGWDVPVLHATPLRLAQMVGKMEPTLLGKMRDAADDLRIVWQVVTKPLPSSTIKALEGMAMGEGHRLSMQDGLAAATALVPRPGYEGWSFARTTAGPHGDNGVARLDDGGWGVWDAQLAAARHTVGAWWKPVASGSWELLTVRPSERWRNGTEDATAGATSGELLIDDVEAGALSLRASGADVLVAEAFCVPWTAPDAFVTAWAQVGAGQLGDFPELRATGDIFDGLTYSVVCVLDEQPYLPAGGMPGWDAAAGHCTFTMVTVDRPYGR